MAFKPEAQSPSKPAYILSDPMISIVRAMACHKLGAKFLSHTALTRCIERSVVWGIKWTFIPHFPTSENYYRYWLMELHFGKATIIWYRKMVYRFLKLDLPISEIRISNIGKSGDFTISLNWFSDIGNSTCVYRNSFTQLNSRPHSRLVLLNCTKGAVDEGLTHSRSIPWHLNSWYLTTSGKYLLVRSFCRRFQQSIRKKNEMCTCLKFQVKTIRAWHPSPSCQLLHRV